MGNEEKRRCPVASGHNDSQQYFLVYTATGAEAQEWVSFVVDRYILFP